MSSSTSTNNNNQNINPRACVYGCGIQIYCNTSVNVYWEVLTKKRHICPNIVPNKNKSSVTPPSNAPKPYYYNNTKKASFSASTQPKPKMSNSFELLQSQLKQFRKSMKFYWILCQNIMVKFMVVKGIEIQRRVLLIYWYIMKCLLDKGMKLNESLITWIRNLITLQRNE